MELPIELWNLIVHNTLSDCYDLALHHYGAKHKDQTERIPTAFSRKGWRQVVRFMLVCKQWEEMMWSFVQAVSCGPIEDENCFPLSFIIKHFPRLTNNLQLLWIQDEENKSDDEDEGEVKELNEEEKNREIKLHNEIIALMELVPTCRNLRMLLLYNSHKNELLNPLLASSSALLPSLERLDLISGQVGDATLEAIGHEFSKPTAALRRLSLVSVKDITEPAMGRSIPLLCNLVELNLFNCDGLNVDSLVKIFGGLSSLTSMDLGFTPALANEEAAKALGTAPFRTCLKSLHMIYTMDELQPEGLESILPHLSGLTALTRLDLSNNNITTAAFRPLASSLTNLKSLALSYAKLDAEGVADVASLPQLEHADLSCFFSDGTSFDSLTKTTTLRSLNLGWSGMNDTNINFISNLTNLTKLTFGSQIRGPGISDLAPLVNLRVLDLTGNSLLDEGVEVVVKTFPRLRRLHLGLCRNLTHQGIAHLCEFTTLRRLDLLETEARTEEVYESLNRMTWLKRLTIKDDNFPIELLKPLAVAGCKID